MADQDLAKTMSDLEQAHGVIQSVQANPAMVERITAISGLLNRRALAGNANCVCGSAQHMGEFAKQ
jgi:hypothetical protein